MKLPAWERLLPHVSQVRLTRLGCGDSSRFSDGLAKQHIARCPECQARYGRIQRTLLRVALHRQASIDRVGPLPAAYRSTFIEKVDALFESIPAEPKRENLLARTEGRFWPSLVNALALPLVALVLFALWHARLPAVSAGELVDRAVAFDRNHANVAASGSIRRRIRIRAGQKTIERSVYLNRSGEQAASVVSTVSEDPALAARLALAGVDWDDPLSAVSFKNWREGQVERRDRVYASAPGLLTVSTELSSSLIVRESLTVTTATFRPVERTVEYRQFGTVDIAQIGSDILEPAEEIRPFATRPGAPKELESGSLAHALLPTVAQMNEAELLARLVLNQQDADTGEQIRILRDDKGVHVEGLVESEQRKQALSQSLEGLPFLSVAIRSFDDLKSLPQSNAATASIEQRSSTASISPLQQYFLEQDQSAEELTEISAGLFNESLAIERSSRSIDELLSRFSNEPDMTSAAVGARDELVSRMRAEILHNLSEQQRLLEQAKIIPDPVGSESQPTAVSDRSLTELADRNLALTKELVSGLDASTRSGTTIATDLMDVIAKLRSTTSALSTAVQN